MKTKKVSVITAIYNQLPMNKIFYENLVKNTFYDFELIIIDNNSNDGSREFFKSCDVIVIENDGNYSYPFCQNQGIDAASGEYLCFLNNDIIVSKDWDKNLIESMEANELEVATSCGIERIETKEATKKIKRKWKAIKNPLSLFGFNDINLRLMHKLMYGNWDQYTQARKTEFDRQILEGFVGNTVVIKDSALEKIGRWDDRIQAADFDLFLRTKERHLTHGDIKPVHIALDTFNHHYIRLTAKIKYPPFKDKNNLISLDEKWGKETQSKYLPSDA
ncbi:glycosyltransferase family 2 protein [Vibrio ulleungensis]|uniref:Glycosyltransferase family 2 protein n=1 Tax=Vibrio ulleungensis TaxID=2807619 RepID=A0ABS2HJI1_9VIBR|nr:glycosyltransferase [Vibrio ulleungensis]MBM7037668.1 glycosyltransferase family 2 protein [Vibrio ulleungensis]